MRDDSSMNKKQKIAICCGILIAISMGLYPPWMVEIGKVEIGETGKYSPSNVISGDYAFLFSPPHYFSAYSNPFADSSANAIGVDTTRLFIQWAMVAALTAGVFIATNRKP
jgi:hypothetical protein